MKLADDVQFQLGMDLYLPVGGSVDNIRRIETHEDCAIESFKYKGAEYHCIGRKGTGVSTDLRHFYSSPANIIERKIATIKQQINDLQGEIDRLEILKVN